MKNATAKIRNVWSALVCGTGLALVLALAPAGAAAPKAATQKPSAMSTMQSGALDINTATEAQLKAIPGIGDVYAKRIVSNRPYTSKDQLVSKGVLPQGVYNKVKGQLVAHRVKK